MLIAGDMLLPRISTNVSVYAATPHGDALGWFLHSLREFCTLPDDTLVLPSHGKPFKGIRARVAQLVEHHRERCDALLSECSAAKTAGELLSSMFPRELDTHQVMFAMGEAIAHLNHLEKRGALLREVGADGLSRLVLLMIDSGRWHWRQFLPWWCTELASKAACLAAGGPDATAILAESVSKKSSRRCGRH